MSAVPPRRCVSQLQPGDRLEDDVFRIQQKQLRSSNNGSLYIHAVLADGTGQVVARMWDASPVLYESMPEGGLMHVRGRIESYKNRPQVIIDGLRTVEPGTLDPSLFMPCTKGDVEVMWNRVKEILRTIRNRDVLMLVGKFVNDPQFVQAFKRAPAATQMHHAYLGGLLEHTLNLLELAVLITPRYPHVSQDLVLAGLFLHDAAKTRELTFETNFEYTDEGQLLGHIVIAVLWLHEKCAEIGRETGRQFPPDIEMVLTHILLAHHGKYEFGSPRLPALPEAILVHYIDNIDAKLQMALSAIETDAEPTRWTAYVRALESRIFKPDVMGIRSQSNPGGNEPPQTP